MGWIDSAGGGEIREMESGREMWGKACVERREREMEVRNGHYPNLHISFEHGSRLARAAVTARLPAAAAAAVCAPSACLL
jgi:hypothetical protein